MRCRQRLIAAILLTLFVPATVASAVPFVYCIGSDGHRAMELLPLTPHHGRGRWQVEAAADTIKLVPEVSAKNSAHHCYDVVAVPTAQISHRLADGKTTLTGFAPGIVGAHVHAALKYAWQESRWRFARKDLAFGNTQLAALSTVILLN